MTTYNLQALLQDDAARAGLVDLEEDSLNAGFELPEDTLSVEVPVDPKSVMELTTPPDEIAEQASALESRHTEWSYLRDDIIGARGMCTQFAQEAIAIKPTFGKGKPLGYYSRHISQTRYTHALEEIDQSMHQDLLTYLEQVKARLAGLSTLAGAVTEADGQEWNKLSDSISTLGLSFKDGIRILEEKGQKWEELPIIEAAAKAFSKDAPESFTEGLRQDLAGYFMTTSGFGMAIVEQSELYNIVKDLPITFDVITAYCDEWNERISAYTLALQEAKADNTPKFEPVQPFAVSLVNGTSSTLPELSTQLRKLFLAASTYQSARKEPLTVDNCLFAAATAAQFSNIGAVYAYHSLLATKFEAYTATVDALIEVVKTTGSNPDSQTFITTEVHTFATKLFEAVDAFHATLEQTQEIITVIRQHLRRLLGLTMVMVETKNTEVLASTDPTLLEDSGFLPSWQEAVEKMRESVAFLC